MDKLTISGITDLRAYGINFLTGEACSLGIRALCDLTPAGRDLVCELLGLPTVEFGEAVNGRDNQCYKMMLPYSLVNDLATVILFKQPDVVEVWLLPYCVRGVTNKELDHLEEVWSRPEDDDPQMWTQRVYEILKVKGVRRPPTQQQQPHIGINNVHHWSGSVHGNGGQ